MDHTDMGYEVLDWIHLAQYRIKWLALANTIVNAKFYKRLFL